jgi:hypothetical protein
MQVAIFILRLVALFVLPSAAEHCFAVPPQPETGSLETVLRRFHVDATTAGVVDLLRQWQPSPANRMRISRLVRQLGSESYAVREAASRQLVTAGPVAEAALRDAEQNSDDLEVVVRARRVLVSFRQGPQEMLMAALRWLRLSPSPKAAPLILDLLPYLSDAFEQPACEALWACTGPGDAKRLRQAVADPRRAVRSAAIPALEIAAGASAVAELEHFLSDPDESLRLAAARALLDRLPRPAIAALIGLLDSRDAGIRLQAAWLLQQASGIPAAAEQPPEFAAAVGRWKAWAGSAAGQHPQPLGSRRLQTSWYGTILLEQFREEVADIGGTYHQLQYETDVGGKAAVIHGRLRLDGNHAEGDQRLYATAQRVLGARVFPRRFKVKATLGGESAGAGAWHVGVSVGNIRLLFHPGTQGGQFRAERVDNHLYLMGNAIMPFTPAAGTLCEMTIDVTQGSDGAVQFAVVVTSGTNSGETFKTSLDVSAQDAGPLERVGLERSGRTGGAALFGSLNIQNAGLTEK